MKLENFLYINVITNMGHCAVLFICCNKSTIYVSNKYIVIIDIFECCIAETGCNQLYM